VTLCGFRVSVAFVDSQNQKSYIQLDFLRKPVLRPGTKPSKFIRPTCAEIDLTAIAGNLRGIRLKVGNSTRILAVVKANAYGHGDVEVSRFIQKKYADSFGVALVDEGLRLREAGITSAILVFSLPAWNQVDTYFSHNLEPTISSFGDAEILGRAADKHKRTIGVQLKVDTGMNRLGAKIKDLELLLTSIRKLKRIEIKGVYTHFAIADEMDKTFTLQQLDQFHSAVETLRHHSIEPESIHCANSSAILDLPQSYCTMVRPGIAMYGYYPSRHTSRSIPLKPALILKTQVAYVKSIDAGESVSYGRRFVASKRTRIATLPVGYADGYSRLLTGKTAVLIHGRRYPVVGTICMDMMMVDVGNADVAVGDEVVLVGGHNGQEITCWDLAERLGTIPYEILCGISSRVPRVYKNR
jgi:alanine racemase